MSIVIPNWNGNMLLKKNLPYVLEAAPEAEIIVADDASMDGSQELLSKVFKRVNIVKNERTQGFSGNVNSGVLKATGDIVVLLNTDVRPEKGFLLPLLLRFSDPAIAAVGCLEKSHEPDGIVLRGRGIARWEKGYFIHSRGDVDCEDTAWVSGGSSAYRRSVWNEIGGMDTAYNPFYWEDIDLSFRIRKAGYNIVFEGKSIVHHYHEEGKIKTEYTPNDVKTITYRNQFLFHWKHIPTIRIWLEHIVWTPIRLVQAIFQRDWPMLQGFLLALKSV